MFDPFKYSNDPIVATTERFVEEKGINVKKKIIKDYILSHPDYPSILSISDCLNYLNIENFVLKISKEDLNILPLPFISHIKKEFNIIQNIENEKIETILSDGTRKKENENYFNEQKTQIVLISETENKTKTRKLSLRLRIIINIILAILLSIAYILTTNHNLLINKINIQLFTIISILLALKIFGLFTCCILVWAEIDIYNPSIKKICSGLGIKTNCNAVLNSKYSKTSIGLSWSEIGLLYFSITFILLLWNVATLNITITLSLLSIVIIILSIYLQAIIIKQWCPLCLTIQALLVSEFVISMWYTNIIREKLISDINIQTIIPITIISITAFILWISLKPLIESKVISETNKYEFIRLKRNPNIFNFFQSKYINIIIPENLGIILGNKKSKNTLVKICNPYCSPCSNAHPEIIELIKKNKNIKVQIIYNSSLQEYDISKEPVRHFLSLYKHKTEAELINSLNDWYDNKNKDYSSYSKRNPINDSLDKYNNQILDMYNWLIKEKILVTPTYYYNGKPVPNQYKISDLEYLLFN